MGYIKKYKHESLALSLLKKGKKIDLSILMSDASSHQFIISYGGAIGDCVLSSYFLASLKKRYPSSKITFIGIPGAMGFLKNINEIDYLFPCEIFAVRTVKNLFSLKAWRGFRKEVSAIRKHIRDIRSPKIAICLNRMDSILGVYKTAMVNKIISADYSIGLNSNESRGLFFNSAVFDPGNLQEHLTFTWSRILNLLDKDAPSINPVIKCTLKNGVLNQSGKVQSKNYCVIHTGGGSDASQSKWVNKRWNIFKFYELAEWLIEKFDCDIVFVGTVGEKDHTFDQQTNARFINMYGKTNFLELLQIIHGAKLYVGNDSGVAHIASFLNVKCYVLWSYASFIDYRPISLNTTLIRLDLPCSPCLPFFDSRACKDTDWEFKCIREITNQQVVNIIETTFN